jgi:hypothetical protein
MADGTIDQFLLDQKIRENEKCLADLRAAVAEACRGGVDRYRPVQKLAEMTPEQVEAVAGLCTREETP